MVELEANLKNRSGSRMIEPFFSIVKSEVAYSYNKQFKSLNELELEITHYVLMQQTH